MEKKWKGDLCDQYDPTELFCGDGNVLYLHSPAC